MITEALIKQEFNKYDLALVQDFIRLFMPAPLSDKRYKYITVKTADNVSIKLWGTNLQEIWDQFQRFIRIGIFI
jgi:hypothetical protein